MENKEKSSVSQAQMGGFYCILTQNVMFCEKLSSTDKLLFALITSLTHEVGYCYASNSYLAEKFNLDKRSIQRSIEHLKNVGFLHVELIKNVTGEIIERRMFANLSPIPLTTPSVTPPHDTPCHPPMTKMSPPPHDKNVTHNNKEINNNKISSSLSKTDSKKSNDFHEEFLKLWFHEKTPKFARESSKRTTYKRWCKITNSGKNESSCQEILDGWLRHVDCRNKSELKVKQLSTFLNLEDKYWLSDWEVDESFGKTEQLDHFPDASKKGGWIDEIPNWRYKLTVAKSKGLLTESQFQEAKNASEWRYLAREYKKIIVGIAEEPKKKAEDKITFNWKDYIKKRYPTANTDLTLKDIKIRLPELYCELIDEQKLLNGSREWG